MTTMVELAAELGKLLETDSNPMRSLLGRMLRLVMEAEATARAARQGHHPSERAPEYVLRVLRGDIIEKQRTKVMPVRMRSAREAAMRGGRRT